MASPAVGKAPSPNKLKPTLPANQAEQEMAIIRQAAKATAQGRFMANFSLVDGVAAPRYNIAK